MKSIPVITAAGIFLLLGTMAPVYAQRDGDKQGDSGKTREGPAAACSTASTAAAKQAAGAAAATAEAGAAAASGIHPQAQQQQPQRAQQPQSGVHPQAQQQQPQRAQQPKSGIHPQQQQPQPASACATAAAKATTATRAAAETTATAARSAELPAASAALAGTGAKLAATEGLVTERGLAGRHAAGSKLAPNTGLPTIAAGRSAEATADSTSRRPASACISAASTYFRLHALPVIYQGYPRFQYGGYSFLLLDPWPAYWSENWFDSDDLYIDYDDGYYLYDRRYPQVALAVSIVL